MGRDRATVANTLRLLRRAAGGPRAAGGRASSTPATRGRCSPSSTPGDQIALGREAARKGLSVREVERRVALLRAPRKAPGRKDPNTRAAEERLRAALGTRVQIARRGKGGALRIAFTSESELSRLFDLILRLSRGR